MNYENVFKEKEKIKQIELKLDLLTKEQVNSLEILKKYGTRCAITDFSILLGGGVSNYHTREGEDLKDRTNWWWLQTPFDNSACYVDCDGDIDWCYVYNRSGGGRPVLPYSSISSIQISKGIDTSGIKEVFYGEYPQTVVDEYNSHELEDAYNNGSLITSGKTYTTDSVKYQEFNTSFKPRSHVEYEYGESKYISVVANSNSTGKVLSNGRRVHFGEVYWIRVEPIAWLVDEEADIALSKKILFSGIQFKNRNDYKGNFDECDIKKFMDEYLSKEIVSDIINYKINNEIKKERKEKTLEAVIEEAKMEMREILGIDYSYILDESREESFQKVKK